MNTETTYNDYQPVVDSVPGQSAWAKSAAAVKRAVRRLMKALIQSHWERHTARELSSLPPYILRDIGLRQEDIREVAGNLARERADAWARQAQRSNGFGG